MKTPLKSTTVLMALIVMIFLPSTLPLHAASIAGAGIELDGKYVGGFALTWDGESRKELVGMLPEKYLTLQRDIKIEIDDDDPNSATLKGKIRLLSNIRGDRQEMARTKVLKLVRKKGKWYVDSRSLKRALAPKKKDR